MAKKKKVKRVLKPWVKKFLVYFVVLSICFYYIGSQGIKLSKQIKYHKTYEYKLTQIGYSLDEAKKIDQRLSSEHMDWLLENEFSEDYYKIIAEKYYIDKNFDEYIKYYNGTNISIDDSDLIVARVNVHASKGFYNDNYDSDLEKGNLVLVNKFYHLPSDYEPENLKKISLSMAYDNQQVLEHVADAYKEMHDDALKELGVHLMVTSSYRSYKDQEDIYKQFSAKGNKYADSYAARPGYSEHQTGLGIDIVSLENGGSDKFGESAEFKWMLDNCYKYGFIHRYPEGKADITGYKTESWHFRYVGLKAAKIIHDDNITFDEYYAYYLDK
jgi:D-alanyl-D-alanine carboxypeptidase